jgi:hypothetical protein
MSKPDLAMWRIELNDLDWYVVFAYSSRGAEHMIVDNHYDMPTKEFRQTYSPSIRKLKPSEELTVKGENGDETKTASEWLKLAAVGLFCSNTYDED